MVITGTASDYVLTTPTDAIASAGAPITMTSYDNLTATTSYGLDSLASSASFSSDVITMVIPAIQTTLQTPDSISPSITAVFHSD